MLRYQRDGDFPSVCTVRGFCGDSSTFTKSEAQLKTSHLLITPSPSVGDRIAAEGELREMFSASASFLSPAAEVETQVKSCNVMFWLRPAGLCPTMHVVGGGSAGGQALLL